MSEAVKSEKGQNKILGFLQTLGRSLMLPIAVLPAAGILLRVGDLLSNKSYFDPSSVWYILGQIFAKGAGAIFDNLDLLFAVGVALGLTANAGAAGLAAVVGLLVLKNILTLSETLAVTGEPLELNTGVLGGIVIGAVAAALYKKYHDIKLPDWLQFFGGKRFVPLITSLVTVFIGVIFLFIWGFVQEAIQAGGNWIVAQGGIGYFIYGVANRLLIPFGLHHIINTFVWFNLGEFITETGSVVTGDITRFLNGDPTAGVFQTGFFPILMFGLPAACLAMIHEAKPENRKAISGVLISAALTAFLTGITEPIEFSFMFLAPVLYLIHAVLTGISMALVNALGIHHGFAFSAGFIDFALNAPLAQKLPLLIGIGLAFAVIYYFLFRFFIRIMNLKTPGREDTVETEGEKEETKETKITDSAESHPQQVLDAVGGKENIVTLDACTTRLRLTVKDGSKVNEKKLKDLGAFGVIKIGEGNYQAVFGAKAELLKDQMSKLL